MRTTTVSDDLYSALEAAANRSGRAVPDLVSEAISAWLAEAAMDDAERAEIDLARVEAAEAGGVEFEAFFRDILPGQE